MIFVDFINCISNCVSFITTPIKKFSSLCGTIMTINNVSICESITRSIKILAITSKNIILQKIFGTKRINKKMHYISFMHNMKWYKYPLLVKHGPKPYVTSILNENNKNVTDKIYPFLGPNLDFYGIKITPKHFEYKILKFIINEKTHIYFEEDIIIF